MNGGEDSHGEQKFEELQGANHRFAQQVMEKRHGKTITRQEMLEYRKKTAEESSQIPQNPYNRLNFNTGLEDQWQDRKKRTLSEAQIIKIKAHFFTIMRAVEKGEHQKYTLKKLGYDFNLNQAAFDRLKQEFIQDPDVVHYLKKTEGQLPTVKISQKKKRDLVLKFIKTNPLFSVSQITARINKVFKTEYQIRVEEVQRLLQDMGFRYQPVIRIPPSQNFQENLMRKKQFCSKIGQLRTKGSQLFFLGVAYFSSYTFKKKGWTRQEYLTEPFINENLSLMALVHESGNGSWKFQKQIHRNNNFEIVSKRLCELVMENSFSRKYVILDYELFHYGEVIKKVREKLDVELLWIPPFSYRLSPVQLWFDEIRLQLRKRPKIKAIIESPQTSLSNFYLIKDVYEELRVIFKQKYSSEFNFSMFVDMVWINHQRALNNEPL